MLRVPVALIVEEVFDFRPCEVIPARIIAALIMDEVLYVAVKGLLQSSFDLDEVAVPVEEVSRELGFDVKSIRVSEEYRVAVWKILYDYVRIARFGSRAEWHRAYDIVFPQEELQRQAVMPQPIPVPPPAPGQKKAEPIPAMPVPTLALAPTKVVVTGKALVAPSPTQVPATADQIAMLCGKFGGAAKEAVVTEAQGAATSAPPKGERVRPPIPADPKLADPKYGATKKAPAKKKTETPKTPEKKPGRGPGQRRAA